MATESESVERGKVKECAKVLSSAATRVTLGSSFLLWKEAKEVFDSDERRRRVKSALAEPGTVTYRITAAPVAESGSKINKAQRNRDVIPASTFMKHLIEVHNDKCVQCNPHLESTSNFPTR